MALPDVGGGQVGAEPFDIGSRMQDRDRDPAWDGGADPAGDELADPATRAAGAVIRFITGWASGTVESQ